ncbi:MAG: response regulator transcription factor [Arenicellales bacterium]
MKSVLVIEETGALVAGIFARHLYDEGFMPMQCSDPSQCAQKLEREQPDLVVIDLTLKQVDGIKLGKEIRALNEFVPILFLVSELCELERLFGQDVIATDYLIKPVSKPALFQRIHALVGRVEALVEKHQKQLENCPLEFDNIKIDVAHQAVETPKGVIKLTNRELDLLVFLASNPGKPHKRARLLDSVWHLKHKGSEHTVNTHVNRLRHKIESDPTHPKYIQTVWGVGYRFIG